MRIAIDGRTIVSGRTGVGVYAERIVRSLLGIDRANEYFLFLVEPVKDLHAPNLNTIFIEGYDRIGRNRFWENFLLPRFMASHSVDLFFAPAYALPVLPFVYAKRNRLKRPRFVVTIHDLIGLLHPETFTRKMYFWQKIFVANAARRADKIITASEATKTDLLKLHAVNEERVTVIYHSIDEDFVPINDRRRLSTTQAKYGLPEKAVLYVGTIEPRKNIVGLAKAFAMLTAEERSDFTLIIAGRPGWYVESIHEEIGRLQLGRRIRFLGYVDRQDLPALYNLSTVFAYPSLYEGFGFPPLEAMSCGIPVLCSNTSSFPEVVGDAAIMVDPHDLGGMSKQLGRLLSDASLRNELGRKGIARSRQFSAQKTAQATLRVFQEVADR